MPRFCFVKTGETDAADENKDPWFVLKDVCEVLELRADNVKGRIAGDDHSTIGVIDRLGRSRRL